MVKKEIGNQIKKVRLQQKLTKTFLAGTSNMTRSQITSIEDNKSDYTFNSLIKVCKSLGIKINLIS
jgi:transcriptional regulator with XRE-family HTH domain